jgi:hypothetical protein
MDTQEATRFYRWDETIDCLCCDGQARFIGALGMVDYYRCRQCGADQNIDTLKAAKDVEVAQ